MLRKRDIQPATISSWRGGDQRDPQRGNGIFIGVKTARDHLVQTLENQPEGKNCSAPYTSTLSSASKAALQQAEQRLSDRIRPSAAGMVAIR